MKKKQIIISAVSLILVCTVFATCIAALILNSSSRLEERTEQTDDSTEESTDESTQDNVPPIKDDPEESASGKPVLDVTDMKRDPNPIVTDSTVEYGTKEADANVE